MGIRYGHPLTAFNGIWGWLQINKYCSSANGDINKSTQIARDIMKQYLKSTNTSILKTSKGHFKDNPNALVIQKTFTQFAHWVRENIQKP